MPTNAGRTDGVSRRSVLRTGAAVGAISLAGLTGVGSAAAASETGGRGMTLATSYEAGVPFTIESWVGQTTFNATCLSAGSATIDWVDGCHISYDDGTKGYLALPRQIAERLDQSGTYAFVAAQPCSADTLGSDVLAIEFRPA